MIDAAAQIVVASASIIIFVRSEGAMARMHASTHLIIRLAMWLLTVGAVANVGAIALFGHIPDVPSVLLTVGIATLLMCERRMRILIPTRKATTQ